MCVHEESHRCSTALVAGNQDLECTFCDYSGPTAMMLGPVKYGGRSRIARHRHGRGYAALVLSGSYVEAGEGGRLHVEAGHVIFHGAHDAHCDAFAGQGAVVLDMPVASVAPTSVAKLTDPDRICRLFAQDPQAAIAALHDQIRPAHAAMDDWPDQLALALTNDPDLELSRWADTYGLAPQSVSRGFRQVFGITPKRYRLEQRALRALRMLHAWRGSLAALAVEVGFADQAHLSRIVVEITGTPPRAMRVQSVQEMR